MSNARKVLSPVGTGTISRREAKRAVNKLLTKRRSADWLDIDKHKPELGQTVLIFTQGYSVKGNHYHDYEVATYIKNPWDGRKKCFANKTQVVIGDSYPWVWVHVTHWMPLPAPAPRIPR